MRISVSSMPAWYTEWFPGQPSSCWDVQSQIHCIHLHKQRKSLYLCCTSLVPIYLAQMCHSNLIFPIILKNVYFYFMCECLSACLSMNYVWAVFKEARGRVWSSRTELIDNGELPRECWKQSLGPTQAQQVLLTAEPSLQLLLMFYMSLMCGSGFFQLNTIACTWNLPAYTFKQD